MFCPVISNEDIRKKNAKGIKRDDNCLKRKGLAILLNYILVKVTAISFTQSLPVTKGIYQISLF